MAALDPLTNADSEGDRFCSFCGSLRKGDCANEEIWMKIQT